MVQGGGRVCLFRNGRLIRLNRKPGEGPSGDRSQRDILIAPGDVLVLLNAAAAAAPEAVPERILREKKSGRFSAAVLEQDLLSHEGHFAAAILELRR